MQFFDTNVLVYTIDRTEPAKRSVALDLVRGSMREQSLAISTQVMLEFYATVLRRRLAAPEVATGLLQEWSQGTTVSTTPELLWRAFEVQRRMGFSLWDATVIQAALDCGCEVLYTEDLQHGQSIGPLKVVNPFRPVSEVHEPAPPYATVAQGPGHVENDKLLRRAIRGRHLVRLVYQGLPRLGEPHDYGLRNGKPQLSFYQTQRTGRSGKPQSWHTLDVPGISALTLMADTFPGPRTTDEQQHLRWDEIYASVTLRPTRTRR